MQCSLTEKTRSEIFKRYRLLRAGAAIGVCGAVLFLIATTLSAQVVPPPEPPEPPEPLASLKTIPVPGPSAAQLAQFVRNKQVALRLGKALFWDMNVGSDNKTACASCHFHAGTDNRAKNQLNPGLLAGDTTFQVGGPNSTLSAGNFPFTPNDVASSQGVFNRDFVHIGIRNAPDLCTEVPDAVFHVGPFNTRRVEPRNTPTVINAVFNFRNFWDGRANNIFNAVDPFGLRNANAFVFKSEGTTLKQVKVSLPSSSLASQAVGPPLSGNEMSCANRSFANLGKKLLGLRPLAQQDIHPNDSVLRTLKRRPGESNEGDPDDDFDEEREERRALYGHLVRKAFKPEYWNSKKAINFSDPAASMDLPRSRNFRRNIRREEVTQMEANFALFFGIAVQLYESTLRSDKTPFDSFADGNENALTEQQKRGLEVFRGQGKCVNCHGGPEFTNASFRNVTNERLELMIMGNNEEAVYDNGFYNIGVRPTNEDIAVGGTDPFGNPLSETRMTQQGKTHLLGNGFDANKEPPVGPNQRVAVDGAFKTPGLRNGELTGPYFHNGGKATLMQVVDFYDRGGDFANENRANLDPDIQNLGLTEEQKQDLVAFLLALTDNRVKFRKAPFDHPSICVPNGHTGDQNAVASDDGVVAKDDMLCVAAVGAGGAGASLPRFLGLDPFQH